MESTYGEQSDDNEDVIDETPSLQIKVPDLPLQDHWKENEESNTVRPKVLVDLQSTSHQERRQSHGKVQHLVIRLPC